MSDDTPQDILEQLAYAVVQFGQCKADCPRFDDTRASCTCGYANAVDMAIRMTAGRASPTAHWMQGTVDTLPDVLEHYGPVCP